MNTKAWRLAAGWILPLFACLQVVQARVTATSGTPSALVLRADAFRHYVDAFNRGDNELYVQYIPNDRAWSFLRSNIPLFECPDKELEEIYYFRWWTFRKAIKLTPAGFIITEFLPAVPWAGKYNSIDCAAGHHFHEGRWLADPGFLNDYARFWLDGEGEPRRYSFWIADSIWAAAEVSGDDRIARELLPALVKNYKAWESDHRDPNGLFWQMDDRDGMELSISGALDPKHLGYRPTINSYMYGDAVAIATIAARSGQKALQEEFAAKAAEIKRLTEGTLWDAKAQFFKVIPRSHPTTLADVRELHGYTPWYFGLPGNDKSAAWKQVIDPHGFDAPYGLTTAEQRDPRFAISYEGHECQWNGPSWPFSTAITLTALANVLNNYQQSYVTKVDYFRLLRIYAHAQHLALPGGSVVPWIDEDINPYTGDWIARTRLKSWANGTWDAKKGGRERGKDYNHSTYCDLIITGLVGLRPRADDTVEVNPLVPQATWDYFCLDQVRYHGHWLTIIYDRDGSRYGKGKGLRVFSDGREIAASESGGRVTGKLAGAAGSKFPATPRR